MVKRVFALAGISALMGTVMAAGAAGCSNDTDAVAATEEDAGVKDAGRDRTIPTPDDDEDLPEESCASKDPVDVSTVPYVKALKSPGACTKDEVKALTKFYSEQDPNNVSVEEWAGTVSDTCAACVFTPTDADAWGPLLVEGDTFTAANRGGCVEIASENEACGRAYEQVLRCIILACLPKSQGGAGTCSTQSEFDSCRSNPQALFAGPCADAYAAVTNECGSALTSSERACSPPSGAKYVFEGTIPVHCGGEPEDPTEEPDAGSDGGEEG